MLQVGSGLPVEPLSFGCAGVVAAAAVMFAMVRWVTWLWGEEGSMLLLWWSVRSYSPMSCDIPPATFGPAALQR